MNICREREEIVTQSYIFIQNFSLEFYKISRSFYCSFQELKKVVLLSIATIYYSISLIPKQQAPLTLTIYFRKLRVYDLGAFGLKIADKISEF